MMRHKGGRRLSDKRCQREKCEFKRNHAATRLGRTSKDYDAPPLGRYPLSAIGLLMNSSRLFLGLGLLAMPALALADRYTLHHRINLSSSWSKRGVITLNQEGSGPIYQDLTGKDRPWDALTDYQADSPHLYQLALTPEGSDTVGHDSPITFARVVSRVYAL